MKPLVAAVAVLVALLVVGLVQARTPEIDALRAEQGDSAFYDIGHRFRDGTGVLKDYAVFRREAPGRPLRGR